jgi:hypothetical protein
VIVSIQQAAANAFAAWLATELPDVLVEPQWPAPDKEKVPKSITVVTAGRRIDTPIDLRLLQKTNLGQTQTTAIWQVSACTQPFQLDIWAESQAARDDIVARLDVSLSKGDSSLAGLFNAMPVSTGGNLIAVGDGWESCNTIADFDFESPDFDVSSDEYGRDIYRATYRGNAYLMLAVTTVTARQVAINFQLRLSESDTPTDFP